MQTCMGCHLMVGGLTPGNKAEIKKLQQALGQEAAGRMGPRA